MSCPKAILFDLDETLAESFQPPTPTMIERLSRLASVRPVAIISGAGFARIEQDVLSRFPDSGRLYLFPNSSTQCYTFQNGTWEMEYNLALTEDERQHIKAALGEALEQLPLLKETPHYGIQISDREAQVAFTAVGLDAPPDVKAGWDPDRAKRRAVVEYLRHKIPDFDILIGGASTIDVTHKGINKTHGVRWFAEHLHLSISEVLYVGDALYPGGNDHVVIETGIQTRATSGPEETLKIIDELLIACHT
ncbi:MAG TPA: HAD-IIB family hydrolase [Candidatus Paceibacterota bacterium]